VNDLADQQQPTIGELAAGLVGIVDGAINAVAEAEFLGEPKGQRTDLQPIPVGADRLDDPLA
jgi:hypothetical protein